MINKVWSSLLKMLTLNKYYVITPNLDKLLADLTPSVHGIFLIYTILSIILNMSSKY